MNLQRAAKLALSLLGSAALAGCDGLGFGAPNGEAPEDPQQTNYGVSPEDARSFVAVDESGARPAPAPDQVCEGSLFEAGARTSGVASAMFAIASIKSGVWPNVDLTQLDEDAFIGYFASLGGSTDAYGRLVEADGHQVMQILVEPSHPEEAPPTRFVLVVDTSSSMRNDLTEVGEVVRQIGGAIQGRPDDTLAILEWGAKSTMFQQEVPGDHAPDLAQAFSTHLGELAEAQLGPGGSLGPMKEVVGDVLSTPIAPDVVQGTHVLVLTDGGVVVDGATFGAIQSWVDQGAIVSFVEVQGDSRGAPTRFHRDVLDTLALAGGGTSLFVSSGIHDVLGSRFDDLLRPAFRDASLRFSSNGLLVDTQDANGSTLMLEPGWSATSRPVFFSIPVQTCDAGPITVTVTRKNDAIITEDRSVIVHGDMGPKDKKLVAIHGLFEVVTEGCTPQTAAKLEMLSALAGGLIGTDPSDALGFGELPGLLEHIAGLCP